jgi:hypothetical protein
MLKRKTINAALIGKLDQDSPKETSTRLFIIREA